MSTKTIISLSDEQSSLINKLLSDTSQQFATAFRELATSNSIKDRRVFITYWVTLSELVLPKVY